MDTENNRKGDKEMIREKTYRVEVREVKVYEN